MAPLGPGPSNHFASSDSCTSMPSGAGVPARRRRDRGEPRGGIRAKYRLRKRRKSQRRIQVIRLRATEGGNGQAVERQVAVDVPKFRYVGKDEFDEDWHLASWVPNDPEGPTVLMNKEAPLLLEAIKHHQQQYPEVFAGEVEKIVKDTYGEVAVCKIAHSQKLTTYVAEDQLDLTYRNEAALTVSLMGLLAEESLIAQRLGKLGRKKNAA
jgi:hypothetical protein